MVVILGWSLTYFKNFVFLGYFESVSLDTLLDSELSKLIEAW